MKKPLFILLLLGLFVNGNAQFLVKSAPVVIQAKFDSLYPGALDVWWYNFSRNSINIYYADFIKAGNKISIRFSYTNAKPDSVAINTFTYKGIVVPGFIQNKLDSLFPFARHVYWNKDSADQVYSDEDSDIDTTIMRAEFYNEPSIFKMNVIKFSRQGKIQHLFMYPIDSLIPAKLTNYIHTNYRQYDISTWMGIYVMADEKGNIIYHVVLFRKKESIMEKLTQARRAITLQFDLSGNYIDSYKWNDHPARTD